MTSSGSEAIVTAVPVLIQDIHFSQIRRTRHSLLHPKLVRIAGTHFEIVEGNPRYCACKTSVKKKLRAI
jgi:hypothetical protein